jgi:hypothetical protein
MSDAAQTIGPDGKSTEELMLSDQEEQIERGLRFTHIMMMVGQSQGNEALAAIMALTDLLVE